METVPHKVLIADDDDIMREVCSRVLRTLGCEVSTAQTGEEALKAFSAGNCFDLVLTDINMPGKVDGVGLCREIKELSPSTDVVIMTGYPTMEAVIEALKKGAYDFLIKPFDPQVLKAVAARCFEKRRLSAELNREQALRRELAAAYSELQKLERMKDAFLGRINHELMTPLSIAFTAAELAEGEKADPEQRRRLQALLRENLQRLREIFQDILLFSQMRSGSLKLERSQVRVPELCKELVEKYRLLWEKKELRVDISFSEGFPLLAADPALLETALKHLLLNAVNFNRRGGAVSVSGEVSNAQARIRFRDTGIGITGEHLPKLFDGFYQAAEYLTRQVDGLGLGLAIVRRIAEAHGGKISVSSDPGQGSEFVLSFPV
ncbi:MAG: response regulator [Elusimicrobiota bacterium]|jgi:signal transduction histidine kinase